jgi:hypothetical protein
MSADRVRFTENISGKLAELGCKKIGQIDEWNSQWETSWGQLIIIPDFGPEDKCPTQIWYGILQDLEQGRESQNK